MLFVTNLMNFIYGSIEILSSIELELNVAVCNSSTNEQLIIRHLDLVFIRYLFFLNMYDEYES